MPSQVTVTGKTGPAQTVTAQVLTNVTQFNLDLERDVAQVVSNGLIKEFDISATATITDSISGGNHTIVINQ
jgi:competence protein ComGC